MSLARTNHDCLGESLATTPPASSNVRGTARPGRSVSCVVYNTVAPAEVASRRMTSSSSRAAASSPACGSSSNQSCARRTTSEASAVRRRCPADNARVLVDATRESMRSRASASSTSRVCAPTKRAVNSTFSRDVSSSYRPLRCPSNPTCRRTEARLSARLTSNTCAEPRVSGTRPAQSRRSVDLPVPFAPRRATSSPRPTERLAPANAGKPPRATTASLSRIAVSFVVTGCTDTRSIFVQPRLTPIR